MDMFECDLLDVETYAKYNDEHRYILSVMDEFMKILHMIPVETKNRPTISSAFRSIFDDPKYSKRSHILLRTDKGKEFLNKHFQDRLLDDGDIQVCRNSDFKCAVVERVHRMNREIICIYFTHKNSTDISMFCLNLSSSTLTRHTPRLAWRLRESRIRKCSRFGRGWRLGDRGAFASQKRRFALGSTCESAKRICGLRSLPNTISASRYLGRESNREAAAIRLRARGFKRQASRRPLLPRGTEPRTHNGPDHL